MQRIWPDPAPLDEAGLIAAYDPDRDRPRLRANFVTSLDGAVEIHGYSRGLSSDADRLVFGLLRMHADAVMVGAGTLRRENYHALTLDARRRAWRREQGLVECPTLVIVSNALELDPNWEVFTRAPVPPVVLTNSRAPLARTAALADVAEVVRCGADGVDLAAGLDELHRRGLTQVLCEGGPHLFGALIAADLVDELCLTVSPLLVGAGPGRIVAGPQAEVTPRLRLTHLIAEDDMLLSRYVR